jgi:hypothetical protein
MITRTYLFNYVTDQYDVLDVETREDGKRYIVSSRTMDLYFGKTNIPKVLKNKC